MPDLDPLAVLVAAFAAFLSSSVWYAAFGTLLTPTGAAAAASARPPRWKLAAELARSSVLATVVAGLASRCAVSGWSGGLLLGLALWAGFPAVLWAGAVLWEGVRPRSAAVHAGDWLAKLLVVAGTLAAWR